MRDSITNQVSYLLGDHLGSVSLLLTASATGEPIVSQQFFMPWGQVRGSGITQTSLNYTGQRLDGTGLLYYHARYYDPALARFVSADSVVPGSASGSLDGMALKPLTVDFHEPGFAATLRDENRQQFWFRMDADDQKDATAPRGPANPQALNRYSYVQNNPVRFTDPTGRCPMCIGALIGAGIDLGVQLYQNGGDFHKVNWVEVGVSAASGALGVGVGTVAAKLFTSVAARVVVNGLASAVISGAGARVQNAFQDAQFAPVDERQAMLVGGVLGSVGSAIGEAAEQGAGAFAQWRYNRAYARASTRTRLSATSNAWRDYGRSGVPASAYFVGGANVAGVVLSNSGPVVAPYLP